MRWSRALAHHLLTEPARPAAVRDRPGAHWLVVGTVCIGAFMGQLDASITTLALPRIASDLGAGLGAVVWVSLSYLLVLVGTVVAIGRAADMVGRKLLYTYGFVLFTLASALCGLAPSLGVLIAARCLQGVGAAMLQANSVALITAAVPRGVLGRALGYQGVAQAVGLSLGPAIGGLLLAAGGWRLVFLVNLPVGVVAVVLAWLLLPRSRGLVRRDHFDWQGALLLSAGAAALLIALSAGSQAGWTSPPILVLVAALPLLGGGLVLRELRTPSPLLDLGLVASRRVGPGLASLLLASLVLFGVLLAVTLDLVARSGPAGVRAGLDLAVLPAAIAVLAPVAGRLADRSAARRGTVMGMLLCVAGLLLLAARRDGEAWLMLGLAVTGAGLGLYTPANNASVMRGVAPADVGVVGGLLNMARGLGTALGVAVAGLVFALAAGPGVTGGPAAERGVTATLLALAAVSLLAAVISATRARTGVRATSPRHPAETPSQTVDRRR